jgi:hypothetical protein
LVIATLAHPEIVVPSLLNVASPVFADAPVTVAESVTGWPGTDGLGLELTVIVGTPLKVAATDSVALTTQLDPLQPAFDHPAKTDPAAAVAVRVTGTENKAEHDVPQLIPAGDEVTVPAPPPGFVTVTVKPGEPTTWLSVFEVAGT